MDTDDERTNEVWQRYIAAREEAFEGRRRYAAARERVLEPEASSGDPDESTRAEDLRFQTFLDPGANTADRALMSGTAGILRPCHAMPARHA